jgi:predicted transcriptional regulator
MKKLTNKEREIMEQFWAKGPMFVRELLDNYEEPKPHFNTLSTLVRILEKNGFVGHRQYGNTYQYYPLVSEQEYGRSNLTGIIKNYFDNSYTNVVSAFVKEEKLSVDELREIIAQIEKDDQE